MKYSELRVLWKPGTPEKKSTQVLVIPMEPFDRSHNQELAFFGDTRTHSCGGVYTVVQDGTQEHNRRRVLLDFVTLVVRDDIDVQAAHAAFCEIQEYRDQLSPDAPVPEKWKRKFRQEVMES